MNRPYPPSDLGKFDTYPLNILPAHDMPLWVKKTFLEPESKVFNNDHYHLYDSMDGQVVFLWANGSFTKQMRSVIGQTEQIMFRVGGFQRMRQEQQLMEWFGFNLPEFIITLDGQYCRECSDVEFMALVDHELSHIGHVLDEFGAPKFYRDSGQPVLGMRDHDVSEFVGVVERYGVPEGSMLEKMVKAANSKPTVSRLDISKACGTCMLKKVA